MKLIPAKSVSTETPTERWLARYLLAAVLIRGANDGAAVGLVLLAVSSLSGTDGGPPANGFFGSGSLAGGAAAGGILVAALNVPHVIGPWIARTLDVGWDSRRILAIGFAAYGVGLAAAALLLGRVPFVLVVGAALLAGCNGPLMGGGLSSRLTTRRALALDSGTWGVATTAGPALASLLAALSGPLAALLTLGGIAVAAAALTLTLPPDDRTPRRTGDHEQIPEKRRADSREGGRGNALKDSHDRGRGESHESGREDSHDGGREESHQGGREERGDSGAERTEVWKTFRRFVACSRREDGLRDSHEGEPEYSYRGGRADSRDGRCGASHEDTHGASREGARGRTGEGGLRESGEDRHGEGGEDWHGEDGRPGAEDVHRPGVFRTLVRHGGLRRVALCTVVAGLGTGTFPVAAPLLSTQTGRSAGAGGLLLSAYGFGSLLGSLLTAARPPGGSAVKRACVYLSFMAVAVVGAASAPTYAVALGCFGLIGLANGPWIAAVLEACRQHSPDEFRAQVFVTISSLKIGAASLAGVSAGLAGAAGGRVILLAAGTAFAAAAVVPALDALVSRPTRRRPNRHTDERPHRHTDESLDQQTSERPDRRTDQRPDHHTDELPDRQTGDQWDRQAGERRDRVSDNAAR